MTRPLAVKIYCGAIVLLFALALIFVSAPLLLQRDWSVFDLAISFVPMAAIFVCLWGVWEMRWWGVAALTILIVGAEAFGLAVVADYWAALGRGALFLIPLWWIAWTYRRQIR